MSAVVLGIVKAAAATLAGGLVLLVVVISVTVIGHRVTIGDDEEGGNGRPS